MATAADESPHHEAWVVGDAASVRGFELAGFAGVVAEDVHAARVGLAHARAGNATLIVVTEAAARLLEATGELESLGEGAVRPLVAVLPSLAQPRLEPQAGERLRGLVRNALGLSAPSEP